MTSLKEREKQTEIATRYHNRNNFSPKFCNSKQLHAAKDAQNYNKKQSHKLHSGGASNSKEENPCRVS